MAEFIKSILVFALITTVIKEIINNESFKMYFKFFSGLVLILLIASPLINFLSGGDGWYKLLEKAVFNFELESINDELNMADGRIEEIIREECRENIGKQIIKMAQERNLSIRDINIKLDDSNSSIQLKAVDIGLENEESDNSVEEVDIKAIDVMSASADENRQKQAAGKDVKKLKKDISSYFLIKEAAINIWE